jgi:RimJ/RimL family protein N-acetyltransferase
MTNFFVFHQSHALADWCIKEIISKNWTIAKNGNDAASWHRKLKNPMYNIAVLIHNNHVIGLCEFTTLRFPNCHIYTIEIIDEHQGFGFGQKFVENILDFLFHECSMNRVGLQVITKKMLHVLKKVSKSMKFRFGVVDGDGAESWIVYITPEKIEP